MGAAIPDLAKMLPREPAALRSYPIAHIRRTLRTTSRTLRFYEEKGLVSPRRLGSRRIYDLQEVARLRLILAARLAGASLVEIRDILAVYDEQSGAARDEKVLEIQRMLIERLASRRDLVETSLLQLKAVGGALEPELAE